MLGKRTRGNDAQDAQQQTKRTLTSLVAASTTKPSLAVTSAKRVAAAGTKSAPMQCTLSQKENQAIQPPAVPQVEHDVFMVDASEQPASSAYSQCLLPPLDSTAHSDMGITSDSSFSPTDNPERGGSRGTGFDEPFDPSHLRSRRSPPLDFVRPRFVSTPLRTSRSARDAARLLAPSFPGRLRTS